MARPCSYATPKVEEWRSIDLAQLRRWKMLEPGRLRLIEWSIDGEPSGVTFVRASQDGVQFLKRNDQGEVVGLFVPFVYSASPFGFRKWFKCPGCWKPCRVLYGVNSLCCRRCRGLRYRSQYVSAPVRLLDRAHRIRCRLGKPGESGEPLHAKPRYMRWRTYRRLQRLVSGLEEAGWTAMAGHINVIRRRVR